MRLMTDQSPVVLEIMKVLGIEGPNVVAFSLHVRADSFVVVEIERQVTVSTDDQRFFTCERFRLTPIEEENEHETGL